MPLNKQQLEVVNQTNFPDNNTKYITPALLRDFNTDMIGAIQLTGSYATTGSNTFVGNQTITGNLNVSGIISASVLYVQTETASVIYSSGSNQFGDELTDIQTLSGSVKIQGQLLINGIPLSSGSATVDTGSLVTTASFNAYTSSTNIRLNNLETTSASVNISISNLNTTTASLNTSITNINAFTASQKILNGTYATTGSNTFTGNQIIDRASKLYTNGIYWTDVTAGYNNLEIINQGGGNLDFASLNGGKVRIVSTPLILTGSALSSSNDISTSANIYGANLTGSTLPSGVISGSAQISTLGFVSSSVTASSLITASFSGNTLTFTKGNGTTFGVVIPDVSGSTIPAGTVSGSAQIVALGFATTASLNAYTTSINSYTQSNDTKWSNLQTTTSSFSSSVNQLNIFTASANTSITNLNSFTSSQLTINTAIGASTSSLNSFTSSQATINTNLNLSSSKAITTASVNLNTITFTKGDASTFNIIVNTGSATTTDITALNSFTASQLTINSAIGASTASLNTFSASTLTRLTNIETTTASLNSSITNINSFTQSANQRIGSLEAATSSYVTSAITGSSLVTASFDNSTRNLTFTKGNTQTFSVNIPDVSGSGIPAGTISSSAQITGLGFVSSSITASSLVTASVNLNTITFTKGDTSTFAITVNTGSGGGGTTNTGSLMLTGSVNVNVLTFTKGDGTTFDLTVASSGSAPSGTVSSSAQILNYNIFATTGSNTFRGNQTISGSVLPLDNFGGSLGSETAAWTKLYVNEINGVSNFRTDTIRFNNLTLPLANIQPRQLFGSGNDADSALYYGTSSSDVNALRELAYVPSGSPTTPNMNTLSASFASTISSIVTGTGFATTGSNTFTGNQNIQGSLTASLQQGYAWVGNASNVSTLVATSSFGSGETINTGSLMRTGSVSGNVLTFTKGDATTFSLTVATGSTINTANFATTGSNTFRGNQIISGTFFQSGSNTLGGGGQLAGTLIKNRVIIGGTDGSNGPTPRLWISGSDGVLNTIARASYYIDATKVAGFGVAYTQYADDTSAATFTQGVYNPNDGSNDVELLINTDVTGTQFKDWDQNISDYSTWLTIGANDGITIPIPTFTRGLAAQGPVLFTTGSNNQAGTATLNGANPGTVTVSNSLVTANSIIMVSKQTNNHPNAGPVVVSAKSAGSFTITSNHNGDTDVVGWFIVNNS